jgi:enterochelin esterase-like enzyme
VRWYLDCGTLEWLTESNRRLAEALREKNYEVEFQLRSAGHNWTNWRNGLAGALRFVLAGHD